MISEIFDFYLEKGLSYNFHIWQLYDKFFLIKS